MTKNQLNSNNSSFNISTSPTSISHGATHAHGNLFSTPAPSNITLATSLNYSSYTTTSPPFSSTFRRRSDVSPEEVYNGGLEDIHSIHYPSPDIIKNEYISTENPELYKNLTWTVTENSPVFIENTTFQSFSNDTSRQNQVRENFWVSETLGKIKTVVDSILTSIGSKDNKFKLNTTILNNVTHQLENIHSSMKDLNSKTISNYKKNNKLYLDKSLNLNPGKTSYRKGIKNEQTYTNTRDKTNNIISSKASALVSQIDQEKDNWTGSNYQWFTNTPPNIIPLDTTPELELSNLDLISNLTKSNNRTLSNFDNFNNESLEILVEKNVYENSSTEFENKTDRIENGKNVGVESNVSHTENSSDINEVYKKEASNLANLNITPRSTVLPPIKNFTSKRKTISSVTDLLFIVPNERVIEPPENSLVKNEIKSTEKLIRTTLADLLFRVPMSAINSKNRKQEIERKSKQEGKNSMNIHQSNVLSSNQINKRRQKEFENLKPASNSSTKKDKEHLIKSQEELFLRSSCLSSGSFGQFYLNGVVYTVMGKKETTKTEDDYLTNGRGDSVLYVKNDHSDNLGGCWNEVVEIVKTHITSPDLNHTQLLGSTAFYFIASSARLIG